MSDGEHTATEAAWTAEPARTTEDELLSRHPLAFETYEGAQEIGARTDTRPDELGREVGAVLRLPESHVDDSDIDVERIDDETMIINMGPQHPSTHGVLRLMMELAGETVLRTKPIVGYLHTGMEKTAEELTYQQGATNVTWMDYLSPLHNELVFSLATEKLLGIELPPRAVWIRMLLSELQRVSSHLMWLATNGMDLGSTTMMIFGFREREMILAFFEKVTGLRMNHNFIRPGGTAADLPDGWEDDVEVILDNVSARLGSYDELLTGQPIFRERMEGVGTITAEEAVALSATGPILRSTGIPWDLRRTMPYLAYDQVEFDVIIGTYGDNFDRYAIRLNEIRESVRILRQVMERIPTGDYRVQDKKVTPPPRARIDESMEALIHHFKLFTEGFKVPEGEVYVAIESSRGELGCYLVSDGGAKPYRMHIRAPSFVNLQCLPVMMHGGLVADAVATISSVDPVMGEVDRVSSTAGVGHLAPEVVERARQLVSLYPHPRSALIPICHLAQEQDGWLRPEAIEEIAALVGVTPAEVLGTASFYEMLRTEPVGRYVISVCTNIACMLRGAYELLDHAQRGLGVRTGATTADGMFTLEEAECVADCGRAPCLQVNHRFFGNLTSVSFDRLVDDLRKGRLDDDVPHHGTLVRVARQGGLRVDDATVRAERDAMAAAIAERAAAPGGGAPVTFTDVPRITTARLDHEDSYTLERYLATGGYEGLRKALSMTPEAVAHEVDAVSLLGRGGAGFPAGRKWSMLRKAPTTYLVVNGDESEPATFKDHLLIERDPHQLIEGVVIAAYAIQATRVFVYIRGEFAVGLERVQQALNDAYDHGAAGADIFGSGFSVDVVVHPGAGAYICGEETALLESLEGKRGFPRIKPPYFPAAVGLYGEPTVVNNVETLSNLPWVITHGSEAFTALGAGRSTGTRLFALAGHVRNPGVYEVEMVKTTFRDLIHAPTLGGGLPEGRELKAIIPGGVSAPWLGPEHLDLPLGQDEVAEVGTMLGSGSVVVMDDSTCVVRAAWRVTCFFWRESCGQCTPCREGSGWLEKVLRRIEDGEGRESDVDLLMDVSDNLAPGLSWPPQQTTICVLGSSIPSSIASAVRMFRDEILVHIKDGRCPYG